MNLEAKRIGVTTWPFGVTWRHRSRDNSIPHKPFPIGGLWEPMVNVTRWLTWP